MKTPDPDSDDTIFIKSRVLEIPDLIPVAVSTTKRFIVVADGKGNVGIFDKVCDTYDEGRTRYYLIEKTEAYITSNKIDKLIGFKMRDYFIIVSGCSFYLINIRIDIMIKIIPPTTFE